MLKRHVLKKCESYLEEKAAFLVGRDGLHKTTADINNSLSWKAEANWSHATACAIVLGNVF